MKRYLTSLFVIVPFFLFSQQNTVFDTAAIDTRLYAVLGKPYIEKALQEDLPSLQWWTFCLDNAYIILHTPPTKDGSEGDFPTVRIPDLAHINILQLEREQNIKRDRHLEAVYRIEGTTKYLVYYSGVQLVEAFNTFRDQLKIKN